jgi:hypothetical protein
VKRCCGALLSYPPCMFAIHFKFTRPQGPDTLRLCHMLHCRRLALYLLKEPASCEALLRRLSIICLEDGLLHPQLPLVVWAMLAAVSGARGLVEKLKLADSYARSRYRTLGARAQSVLVTTWMLCCCLRCGVRAAQIRCAGALQCTAACNTSWRFCMCHCCSAAACCLRGKGRGIGGCLVNCSMMLHTPCLFGKSS